MPSGRAHSFCWSMRSLSPSFRRSHTSSVVESFSSYLCCSSRLAPLLLAWPTISQCYWSDGRFRAWGWRNYCHGHCCHDRDYPSPTSSHSSRGLWVRSLDRWWAGSSRSTRTGAGSSISAFLSVRLALSWFLSS